MTGKQNKGITMVEIMIAIAVFAILLIPIVGGLMSSMESSTQSKELQYRNDYAEDILEYIKTDSIDNILTGDYLIINGSTDVSVTRDTFWNYSGDLWRSEKDAAFTESDKVNATTTQPNPSYNSYQIQGKVRLGTKHTLYSYFVSIDNKYYATQATKDENGDGIIDADDVSEDRNGDGVIDEQDIYSNPNDLRLGIVEDLDKSKVAVFDGKVLANRDTSVMAEFQSRIVSAMREKDPEEYKRYMSQATGYDFYDNVTRVIRVEISGDATNGYVVSMILDYIDDDQSYLGDPDNFDINSNYISQPIDTLYYQDELPNIYLMYNPCSYNGYYMSNDYIVFDCTGVTDDTEVTAFVVETAEKYSENIANTMDDLEVSSIDGMGRDENRMYTRTLASGAQLSRDNVTVHLVAVEGKANSSNAEYKAVNRLKVYHNFKNTTGDDGSVNRNKKNDNVLYSSTDDTVDYFIRNFYSIIDSSKMACPLIEIGQSLRSATLGFTDSANEEKRGLYQVSIWMEEGDVTVDTSKEPILQGSKGGGES